MQVLRAFAASPQARQMTKKLVVVSTAALLSVALPQMAMRASIAKNQITFPCLNDVGNATMNMNPDLAQACSKLDLYKHAHAEAYDNIVLNATHLVHYMREVETMPESERGLQHYRRGLAIITAILDNVRLLRAAVSNINSRRQEDLDDLTSNVNQCVEHSRFNLYQMCS